MNHTAFPAVYAVYLVLQFDIFRRKICSFIVECRVLENRPKDINYASAPCAILLVAIVIDLFAIFPYLLKPLTQQ